MEPHSIGSGAAGGRSSLTGGVGAGSRRLCPGPGEAHGEGPVILTLPARVSPGSRGRELPSRSAGGTMQETQGQPASPPLFRDRRGRPGRLPPPPGLGVPCWGSSPSGLLSAPPGAQDRPHPCLPPGPEAEGVMQVGCRVTRDGGQEPGVWGRLPVGLHCSIVGVLSLSLSPLQERGGSADPSVPTISGTGGRGDSMDPSVPTISGTGWGALVSLCALPTAPRLSGRGGSTGSGSCPWS